MTGRFKFQRLSKYPGMKPEDIAAWERFIDTNPGYFETVDYNVPCGPGAPVNPDHAPEIQYDHTILTQKKIDVVGYRGDAVTIVEVKPIADMRALGQVITYKHLYAIDHPDAGVLTGVVVAGDIERDLPAVYATQGVLFEQA